MVEFQTSRKRWGGIPKYPSLLLADASAGAIVWSLPDRDHLGSL